MADDVGDALSLDLGDASVVDAVLRIVEPDMRQLFPAPAGWCQGPACKLGTLKEDARGRRQIRGR